MVVLGTALGCGAEPPPITDPSPLLAADRALYAAVAAHDAEAFADLVDEAAVFFGTDVARGRTAVAEAWQPIVAGELDLRWAPDEGHVSTSGDLGYTIGTAEYRVPGEDGATVLLSAQYVTIWRRGPDGIWRAAVDIGTRPKPVEPPPETPAHSD
jgi:ketosteroid isomerase-like protein